MVIKNELLLRLKNIYEDNIVILNSLDSPSNNFDLDYLFLYKSFALSTARLNELICDFEKVTNKN